MKELKYTQEDLDTAIAEERDAWIDGKRCIHCGNEIKSDGLTDTCANCWEEL